MKIELVRDGVLLELDQSGRQVFITEGEASTIRGFFDEADARAAWEEMVAARQLEGWNLSPREQAKRQMIDERQAAVAAVRARVAAAASTGPAGAAILLASLAGAPRFSELVAEVESVVAGADDDGDIHKEAVLHLRHGGHLRVVLGPPPSPSSSQPIDAWFVPTRELVQLWLTLGDDDGRALADDADHNLYFGGEAGPPEADSALDGTPWAHTGAEWFVDGGID